MECHRHSRRDPSSSGLCGRSLTSEMGFKSRRGRQTKETHGEHGRGKPYPRKGRLRKELEEVGAMSLVFVVDEERRLQRPVHPGYARWLLSHGKAAVLHRAPFTLILKRTCSEESPSLLRLKLDPGSKTTGLAVVDDGSGQVMRAAELTHRGEQVKRALDQRRGVRRSRRQRHTRYRKPRFRNRKRKPGWQPPSRLSRVQNVMTWVERLRRWCPIGFLSLESVRFDLQRMQQP